jgi:hypothetical protein
MIVPARPTDGRRQRAIAFIATAVFLGTIYAGLRAMPVPAFGGSNALIRRLDPLFVERYSAPPEPEPETPADADPGPEPGPVATSQEVTSAIDELTRRFREGGGGDVAAGGSGRGDAAADAGGGISSELGSDRFSDLFGGGAVDPLPGAAPRVRTPPAGGTGGGGIEMGAAVRRSGPTTTVTAESDDIGISTAAPTGRSAVDDAATDVEIKEYEAENFNATEVGALSAWMRANPTELPAAVKVHLNYLPAFLTAVVPVVSGDRQFDLFLMYNESLRELHILMVEGDRSVYLIDRGFQAQSRSLREGIVRRMNGEIMTVDSQQRAASSGQAQAFYNIFLSWWEVARADVRR